MERDHIIPKSQGGDGKTANLQLLHGHCHDVKTAKDKAVEGTRDKSHIAEEPCEGKSYMHGSETESAGVTPLT